ncbi:MAG: HAMP domain-containing histidine kinase [Candidatus Anammoximicrobium sp.]|nr:HAMP domain-containing histidine kinase [Candidatus Anammoximicrobium sp.]
MFSRWSIRKKLWLNGAMLVVGVALLAFSSFRGVYAYRWLARNISYQRATELRLAMDLSYRVGELRSIVSQVRRHSDFAAVGLNRQDLREAFRVELLKLDETLRGYDETLHVYDPDPDQVEPAAQPLFERQTVAKIRQRLDQIAKLNQDDAWVFNELQVDDLDAALADLHSLTLSLPQHLQQRLRELAGEVRGEYRTWIVLTWISSLSAVIVLFVLANFFRRSVFQPLGIVVQGSRRIARDGDFEHRIQLRTHDEIAELAGGMNAMTERFLKIRDDLDRQIQERDEQVRQRTKQVVRSEQLAAVGFLAAGVAHEINNPLAAIAWAAESLEMRLHDLIQQDEQQPDDERDEDIDVLRKYLRKIQDEAFRCKGITERLLDYSRMGDVQKHPTDLSELVQGVIDMVRHLGKYREKNIEFDGTTPVVASVNAQEIKQVVLNLITNALDSLDPGGTVSVRLRNAGGGAELVVRDNGCGMTEEVLQHIFEPFFTRRRGGQGIGLGLSITYRIVQDHGGEILPHSDGPGRGSEFKVTLPLVVHDEENRQEKQQAA